MSELVDYERAFLHMKAYVGTKRSHGARELAEAMARIEVESMYRSGDEAPRAHASDVRPLPEGADEPPAAMPESKDPLAAQGGDSWTPTSASSTPPTQTPSTSPPLRAVSSK